MKIPIVSDWLKKREQRSFSEYIDAFLRGDDFTVTSKSGVKVNESTTLNLDSVLGCIKILSETIASLPLQVYERVEEGKQKASTHSVYNLLHLEPNSIMTSFVFRELAMLNLLIWGNFYAEIEEKNGEIKNLWPLPPWRVEAKLTNTKKKYFDIKLKNGKKRNLRDDQVLHIPGMGWDGVKGFSPLSVSQDTFGMGIALEEFTNNFFSNGMNVGSVAEHPGKLSKEAADRLRKDLREKHEGLGNAHRLMLLEEGMKFSKSIFPPNDAQMLESRKFSIEQIARIYRVPLHLLQHLEKATNNNIEHQGIDFVVHTIRPWLIRWEQGINTKLFTVNERVRYFAEFNVEGLLRGDIQSRYAAYATGRQWGWLSVNDIREKENMNKKENGDIYLQPMNMVEAGTVVEQQPIQQQEQSSREKRSTPTTRHAIAKSFKQVFEDATSRIVRREKADIMRTAKKMLGTRASSEFSLFIDDFYREHPQYVEKQITPAIKALSEAIMTESYREANKDAVITDDYSNFVNDLITAFTAKYVGRSKGQLESIIANTQEDELLEALEQRFNEWEERRPNKVATEETVKVNGAVSRFAFAAAGVQWLVWRNMGSKTCPYCEQMNGKRVSIAQPFIDKGSFIEADDGSGMKVYGPKMHPPIHQGCVCSIEIE